MSKEAASRIVFLGSGAFGIPTLESLHEQGSIRLVVTQPDRPAGRGRESTPTPIAQRAEQLGLQVRRTSDVNSPEDIRHVRSVEPDAMVIVAFGQKLGDELLENVFSINLHASLLPRWRGAAPINWSIIAQDPDVGVSVISIASRMDAGLVYATRSTWRDPMETAGQLHDRLASMGPEVIQSVLQQQVDGSLQGEPQDESMVTQAGKLSRADSSIDFTKEADTVQARIHGLVPWPGCSIGLGGSRLSLLLVETVMDGFDRDTAPGTYIGDGLITCGGGAIRMIQVKAPGKRAMGFSEYAHGHQVPPGTLVEDPG